MSKKLLQAGVALAALVGVGMMAAPALAETKPVQPYYGNLRPFYGNLRPFYGNLRPFYGNLRPFWGNLRPFWGDTAAFYGDLKSFWAVDNPVVGAGAPDYLKIGDFWQTTGTAYQQAFDAWNTIPSNAASSDYRDVTNQLKAVVDDSRKFWGEAVRAKTGQNFDQGFANAVLAKYGIDLSDPGSLAHLDQTDRALFFLDWYDGLMNFSGTDHVDHWMKTVNWTPSLTRTQGAGGDTTIGILDMTFVGDASISGNIVKSDGVSDFTNGHGAAVASLIVGHHDGEGVMGIAPKAKVIAYNPFDSTGTAGWADITKGVQNLKANGASIVNMSLGVPGTTFDPGWNGVFTNPSVMLTLKNTVFVMAAGNDGVTQSANVPWNASNPAFIVVGSVDVDGNISNFSNRPGEACLTTFGVCTDRLKDHFIVAPGELILVSDGQGGVTRQIGTSFAAPLVSGAIALLHDRWPWLVNFPRETTKIILDSAKDLGAPGVDPVYGHGLLDVTASQSPLSFNNLMWFTVQNGKIVPQTRNGVISTYQYEQQKSWDAQGAYFYAFEPIGLTQRDFAIPLSQKLIGQNVTTYMGAQEQFQAYLLSRMDAWVKTQTQGRFTAANSFAGASYALANPWGADMSVSFAPRQARYGFRDEGPAYQSAFHLTGEKSVVTFGFGDGAPALAARTGFVRAGDYDADSGGANPLLGLASGGAYAGWSYSLSDRWELSTGALARDQKRDTRLLPALGVVGNGAERYSADAQHVSLSYKPSGNVSLTGGYTRLHEGQALLGMQSFDPADFRRGSTTDGYSLSVSWAASPKLSLMATGTMGRTHGNGEDQALAVGRSGVTTSSFEVGLTRSSLFAAGDQLQLAVSQPMYVERGKLDITTVRVVDRQTGELGIVTQSFDITAKRRLAAEALYLRPLPRAPGDVALFGRVETEDGGRTTSSAIAGARLRVAF